MIYLKDTCVLIKNFDTLELINMSSIYKENSDIFALTDIIIDELKPGKSVNVYDTEKSNNLLRGIGMLEKSHSLKIYEVNKNEKYKANFERIRRQFYGHLRDLTFVRKAVKNGEITTEQFRNRTYIYKDYGECSCIAVAIENPTSIFIVSDDKGRIFLKPDINLFNEFTKSHKIGVLSYIEWKKLISESEIKKKA